MRLGEYDVEHVRLITTHVMVNGSSQKVLKNAENHYTVAIVNFMGRFYRNGTEIREHELDFLSNPSRPFVMLCLFYYAA